MQLHTLAAAADISGVRRLLAEGAAVDIPDPINGLTPLMVAVESTKAEVDMLRLLIENGANVNAVSSPPPPPPMPEEWLDNLPEEIKKDLPDLASISFHGAMESEYPVLFFAVKNGHPGKITCLLEHGADLHYRRPGGYDILIDALHGENEENYLPVVELLIQRGAKIDGRSSYGESALGKASQTGRFDIVKRLLDAGANIDELQWTPLMHATVFGSVEDVFNLLLKRPYTPERDSWGRTAFLLAVQAQEKEKAAFLLDADAGLTECDKLGCTALMYAAAMENGIMLSWLLDLGASITATDKFGNSALVYAIQHGCKENVKMLLAYGADLFAKNNFGETPVNQVVHPEIMQLLVEWGVDWNDAKNELRRALAGLPQDYTPQLTPQQFTIGRDRRFGRRNPEEMKVVFWDEMIRSGKPAGWAWLKYDGKSIGFGKPIWCYQRFGQSINVLPDGRIVEIGGEHEDYYDENFCIYNDVVVFTGKGDFIIYGYPKEVFPPTDFHSATLVGDSIFIIGGLGYQGERHFGKTPVYCLDTNSFTMQQIITTGAMPGWIFEHRASTDANGNIRVSGGKVCRWVDNQEKTEENSKEFILDLGTLKWTK